MHSAAHYPLTGGTVQRHLGPLSNMAVIVTVSGQGRAWVRTQAMFVLSLTHQSVMLGHPLKDSTMRAFTALSQGTMKM